MSVLAQFSVVPLGEGTSMSAQVARVISVVQESGIAYRMNAMGTVLEGEWDEVLSVIRRCHAELRKDHERVLTSITLDDREGRTGRMNSKPEAVERKLGKQVRR